MKLYAALDSRRRSCPAGICRYQAAAYRVSFGGRLPLNAGKIGMREILAFEEKRPAGMSG